MRLQLRLSLASAVFLAFAYPGLAAADTHIRVVASINPVHSLVSAVMAGAGEPYRVMHGAGGHHTFNMRPSHAAALQESDVIFIVHRSIESALASAIDRLSDDAVIIELSEAQGLVLWPLRAGGTFEADPAHDHDHDDAHGHSHAATDHGHGHADHGHADHGHGHSHGHTAGEPMEGPFDLHTWLDPVNAQVKAHRIADVLAETDPSNAALYKRNAYAVAHRLEHLIEEIEALVAPARNRPFLVFHDGYRYFEERFGLSAVGTAIVSTQRSPGARRIRELRARVEELGVVCLFDEPHFDQRLVKTIVEGTGVRTGTIDPLGSNLDSGPEMYFTLLRNMAASFRDCLVPQDSG